MTAKEYLGQAYRLDQRIDAKLEQVSSLRALATKATATISDMPRSSSPNLQHMESSNEELDFIKNNVNILLILCEENLLRMDSIINVMHKSQIRFEVQSRDLMQEFDESVLCNNTIDFIQKNKLPIVSHLNMKRNVTLYSNTNAGIRNQCYDGRIFISLDGSVGVCKQYLLPLSIINNKSWADIIHQLAKMWKKTFTSPVCENCGLSALCISCQRLHELYLKQSTEFPRAICFTQQSGKNKHRKEEEIHA